MVFYLELYNLYYRSLLDVAIHCDVGDHCFCYNCIGMTKKLFAAIRSEATPMLYVSCDDCRSSSLLLWRKVQQLNLKQYMRKLMTEYCKTMYLLVALLYIHVSL